MVKRSKNFFITTPIYYANDRPHIGSAYSTLLACVLARQKRKEGYRVHFATGTDEHGAKIVRAAEEAGKEPQALVDEIAKSFYDSWKKLNISFDDFIRTTEKRHEKAVQYFLTKLKDSGTLYQGAYRGLYCVGCETFLEESELVNGLCPDHLKKPELLEEKNWFFKLSQFREKLQELILQDKLEIRPLGKKAETLGLLKTWANDVSISRQTVSWGIPLPFDQNQIIYVWVDALINYLTTIGYPDQKYKEFWPADIHIIGKNILKHHAVIWPALLLALGLEPPKKIFAHSFVTIEGQKMSKSLGNVIAPENLIEELGVDGARYILLAEITPDNDSDLSWDKFRARYDADLKHNIGNIFSRLIVLAQKNNIKDLRFTIYDLRIDSYKKVFLKNLEAINIPEAIKNTQKIFEEINQYLDKTKPWKETDKIKIKKTLQESFSAFLEGIELLEPIIPETAKKVLTTLLAYSAEAASATKAGRPSGFGGQVKKDDTIIVPKENVHLF
ncbi:MAG: methionine--tRNA ligase [Candidatus Portnoybacteria bacterium]|nr:methionine--tRNA ligase [Candidatus Portnoybacteria bacterium]